MQIHCIIRILFLTFPELSKIKFTCTDVFDCHKNKSLESLKGLPKNFSCEVFNCHENPKLKSVKDLPKGSHTKVLVKCDICGKEKELN